MIQELINFTNGLDSELKAIGMTPKEGLHILLSFEEQDGQLSISDKIEYEVYSKKDKEVSLFLRKCELLRQATWMIDTNKCIDNITRAIHSCSPFSLAIKRTNFNGGKNFVQRMKEGKTNVYGSLENYFSKTDNLIEDEKLSQYSILFKETINSEQKIHHYFSQIPEYDNLKDDANTYVIFYLNVDLEDYTKAYKNYFTDESIFNSNVIETENGWYGASGFFNGFNSKKPFLKHQSASFDITGRVSANDAKTLFEFESIIGRRNVLPNPLPIFVYGDELRASIDLFKADALDGGNRKGHKDIIDSLLKKLDKNTIGNYYLLYYQQGEIKDFDFVSQFEYRLLDENGENWEIEDSFGGKYSYKLENVFDFERKILPIIFNNALIVRTKTDTTLFKYFDDIDAQYCKSANTFLLVMTYRNVLYNFIYKSNRNGFTQKAFENILLTGILDDIRLDIYENKRHSEDLNIRQKLNVLFSLYHNFQPFKQNSMYMTSNVNLMREFTQKVISKTESIIDDEQFAFISGQITRYLHSKSKSADRSYNKLEGFLQKTNIGSIKEAMDALFRRYKHEKFSKNFGIAFSEVNGFAYKSEDSARPFKYLMPLFLAGYFSECYLFADKTQEPEIEEFED